MKLRLFVIPGIFAVVLFGQGFGGQSVRRGVSTTPNQPAAPQTPAQIAARQIQFVVTFLKLDSTQSSALAGDTGLAGALTNDQTTLESNDEMLRSDYAAMSSQLIGAPAVPPAELAAIQTLLASNFQTRVTIAGEIVSALQSLSEPLSADQTANLPGLVGTIVGETANPR